MRMNVQEKKWLLFEMKARHKDLHALQLETLQCPSQNAGRKDRGNCIQLDTVRKDF